MEIPTPGDIREKRKDLGLTQSKLADGAGVSQPLVARIESGDVDPRLSTVKSIVEVFDKLESEEVYAEQLMSTKVKSISPDDTVHEAVEQMHESQYSQLPVIDNGIPVGSASDAQIAHHHSEVKDLPDTKMEDVMGDSFPTVSPETGLNTVERLLDHGNAVLVTEKGKVRGIITDADIAAYVGGERP
ncbi:MAG: CBS domain-containing protein [Halobacteria archaeon]